MSRNTYSDKYGRKNLGDTRQHVEPAVGFALWAEDGEWITAPTVDAAKFGGHDYDNGGYEKGIRDCKCGAYMLSSSSAGPVDPFGPCPENPKAVSPSFSEPAVDLVAETEVEECLRIENESLRATLKCKLCGHDDGVDQKGFCEPCRDYGEACKCEFPSTPTPDAPEKPDYEMEAQMIIDQYLTTEARLVPQDLVGLIAVLARSAYRAGADSIAVGNEVEAAEAEQSVTIDGDDQESVKMKTRPQQT